MARTPQPLRGLDALFLYLESAGTPMHVGSLMRLDAPRGKARDLRAALQAQVESRLAQAPALRRVLHDAPLQMGHPLWIESERLDLRRHILQRRLRAPGGEKQLLDLVARLHAEPLPRDRPLWQFVVIEGLADGGWALYAKVHHALLDGQGGVALARVLLDIEARTPDATAPGSRPRTRGESPGTANLADASLRAGLRQLAGLLRSLPPTLRAVAGEAARPAGLIERLRRGLALAPRTRFNRQIGSARRIGLATLPLERLKTVARRAGVSLNDVVLALCSEALRGLLREQGELPRASLVAAMPVSLRAAGDGSAGNQVSMLPCALHTDIEDPKARLAAIAASTAAFKRTVGGFRDLLPTDFPGFAAPLWASGLTRLWARGRLAERLPLLANLVISNVPGPPAPLYVAGCRLTDYYPLSIVTHGLGLNITVQSYAGRLDIGITACREALPEPGRLSHALAAALDTLEQCLA